MLQLLWRHRLPLLLLAAYWAVALGLYLRWERENWYPITGDEPHYISVGRSLLEYGTLEMTQITRDAHASDPDYVPQQGRDHLREGRNGLYGVHSIGVSLIAIPGMVTSDIVGYHNDILFIKSQHIFLSGMAVLATWLIASIYVQGKGARVLAVVLVCIALPLLVTSSQVFADWLAGVVALGVVAYLAWRTRDDRPAVWADVAALAAVSCLPWLHYKFVVAAAILGLAALYMAYRSGASRRHLGLMLAGPAFLGIPLLAYNALALGALFPGDPDIRVTLDERIIPWLLTFSIDRWHGFLLQNPVYFIGLLFYVPFIRKEPFVAAAALLACVATIGINAAHGHPGYSFAGRHAWTGALLLVPAVVFGLGQLETLSTRALWAVGGCLVFLQAIAIIPLAISKHDLYHRPTETWFDVYPSFYPEAVNRFLPAIYNNDWWSGFAINYLYIAFAVALLIIGAVVHPRRRDLMLPAAGGLLAITLPLAVLVSFVQADPPREPRRWAGSQMHRNFGIVLPGTVKADVDMHSAGIWTFGPYMKVAPGEYRVTFVFSADAPPDVKVGSWDVTGRAGRVRFAEGDLYGSNGLRAVATGTLKVESGSDGESFEMRTRFDDVADLLLREIILEPAE